MKNKKEYLLKDFYILWGTQSLSQLGSSITAFALTLCAIRNYEYIRGCIDRSLS